jgi:Rod binding domain-containing protein
MSLSMSTIDTSRLPAIDQAREPAQIRNGGAAAQQAYRVGLAFEQVLVDQLAQQLADTSGGSSSSQDGSSDAGTSASGLMGSDPATSMYAQMLPQALSSGIMSAGGVGLALQLARGIDPALNVPATSAKVKP